MTATTQLEERKAAVQLDANSTAMIEWNEQESRFDIRIHLIAERHSVTYFGHPSRGIETLDKAIEFARAMLSDAYLDYDEYLRSKWF